jgi:hypothetical protein
MKRKEILFFTPNVALWVHTVPEYFLAKGLKSLGNNVRYLSCGRAQSYCASMTAAGLDPSLDAGDGDRICDSCTAGASIIKEKGGMPLDFLSEYLTSADRNECEALVAKALKNRSLDTELMGINVGRLALYELVLMHKKMTLELSVNQWGDYCVYLYNALIALMGFSKYFDLNKPSILVAFSPQYSNISPVMQHAINMGCKAFFIESGTNISDRLGTMRIWDWDKHKLVNPALLEWPGVENFKVTEYSAKKVGDHYNELLGGLHFSVYSSSGHSDENLYEKWGITADQKVLIATLSSYDEAYAAHVIGGFPVDKVFSGIFRTQHEWIKSLISWVENHPEFFLIIRVHPRDFPNKRELIKSEQAHVLADILTSLPNNIYVNWPSESISIYEIFGIVDVVLTGWSVTAIEALVLGIPVVVYDIKLPSYPSDIVYSGESESEYYDSIVRAVAVGWSFMHVVSGFRWAAFNFSTSVVSISEKISQMEFPPKTFIGNTVTFIKKRLPRSIIWRLDIFFWRRAIHAAKIFEIMIDKNFSSVAEYKMSIYDASGVQSDIVIIRNEYARIIAKLNSNYSKSNTSLSLLIKANKYLENH